MMGSDIYTESAVAIRLEDFLNRKELIRDRRLDWEIKEVEE